MPLQCFTYYLEGYYVAGGANYFDGPYDHNNLGSALCELEASSEIILTDIIIEKD